MVKFIFNARNQAGERVNGVEDAENADDLISRLQIRGLFVTSIKVQTAPEAVSVHPKAKGQTAVKHKFSHGGLKEDDLILFCRQLAIALGSGVPLLKSLDVISRQISSRKFFDIVNKINHDVESGFSLRDALAKHPKAFSNLWINMVETGEASGNLPIVLDRLARYLEVRASFKSKIISAMIYPLILMFVAAAAITVFLLVIVPKFTEIFKGFGTELPAPTKVLIFLSDMLKKNFFFILLGIGGIIFCIRSMLRVKSTKKIFDSLIFKIPAAGEFFCVSETEKFCSAMATLLESGVPILYALEIAERSSNNLIVMDIIRNVKDFVREGGSLAQPLEQSGFFPPMVTQMVAMGEEIGELDSMFKKISNYYSELMETQITRFTATFEPMMIIFMGVIIGSMVISMFLPIFKIAGLGGG